MRPGPRRIAAVDIAAAEAVRRLIAGDRGQLHPAEIVGDRSAPLPRVLYFCGLFAPASNQTLFQT